MSHHATGEASIDSAASKGMQREQRLDGHRATKSAGDESSPKGTKRQKAATPNLLTFSRVTQLRLDHWR